MIEPFFTRHDTQFLIHHIDIEKEVLHGRDRHPQNFRSICGIEHPALNGSQLDLAGLRHQDLASGVPLDFRPPLHGAALEHYTHEQDQAKRPHCFLEKYGKFILSSANKQRTFHRGKKVLINFRIFNRLGIEQGIDPDLGLLCSLGPNGNRQLHKPAAIGSELAGGDQSHRTVGPFDDESQILQSRDDASQNLVF